MTPARITRRRLLETASLAAAALAAPGRSLLAQAAPGPPAAAPGISGTNSLKAHAAAHALPVGAAVDVHLLRSNETYRQTLQEQFSMVVGENCMKWAALRPTPDTYDFTEADELVSFAGQHGMLIRGHNLCWHESQPKWFEGAVTRDNAAKVLTDHIRTVVTRYKGRMHSWDVVNEAIWIDDKRPDGLRTSSPWFQLLGPDYIDLAFRTAREADPTARLTYNDYGIECDLDYQTSKRTAVMDLLKRLRKGGTPIDAVGIQSHLKSHDAAKLGPGIAGFVAGARKLGLEVYLTELDVDGDTLPDEPVAEQDLDIADVYARYLKLMLSDPAVRAVLTWGVADDHTWLNGAKWRPRHPDRLQRPLPFDPSYRPAPAFFAMRDAFDHAAPRPKA